MAGRTNLGTMALAAIVFTAVAAGTVGAQDPTPSRQPPAGRGRAGSMMSGRQTMQAEMEAQARRLDALVAAMNAAGSAEKADRVAAVVNELVAQHKAMHTRMMAMPMMAPAAGDAATPSTPAPPPGAAGDEHAGHHPADR